MTAAAAAALRGDELRPVPRERAILESFFTQLGMFSFDRAKDYVEKEKDSTRSAGAIWTALLAALGHLAAAEKAYYNMTFLGQKLGGQSFFSRKDSIRTIYASLYNELRQGVAAGRHAPRRAPPPAWRKLLAHLAEQLCHFHARRAPRWPTCNEKMHALADAEVRSTLRSWWPRWRPSWRSTAPRFHHPILGRVEGGFQTEVDVVSQLLRCQAQVSEWRFLPALLGLHGAHSKLAAWGLLLQRQKETRKHLFGGQSQRPVPPPHLYVWLRTFQASLLAKFTLYFHEALSRQAPAAGDMRALASRAAPDYHGRIAAFVRKHDASSVSLLPGHGYHHPASYREAPKGVEQYPAVVSVPAGDGRAHTHWPAVVMLMGDRATELNALDKAVHFYDDKAQSTYYLARPERHFTLVVIFEGRRSERDTHVAAFLQEVAGALRTSRPFATLKPGSKG
ncbi:hypothetical protein CRUP_017314 [Coryphaenoides rupestris]|nr:hypothetical protein CRUP_017314 [Coryphaenoides rupestris]